VIRKKSPNSDLSDDNREDTVFWAKDPADYGWFMEEDRYGWIDSLTGRKIKPIFSDVYIVPHLGISIVVINSHQKKGRLFGMVDHRRGRIIRKPDLNMIYIQDFEKLKVARAQYSTGAFVLVNARGKMKLLQRTGYIGPFKHGIAVANTGNQYAPWPMQSVINPRLSNLKKAGDI
jgi:hypothetical protein